MGGACQSSRSRAGFQAKKEKADCLWGSTLLSPGAPGCWLFPGLNWFVPAAMAFIYLSLPAGAVCPDYWQNPLLFRAGRKQKGYLGKFKVSSQFVPYWRNLDSLAHQQDRRLEPRIPVTALLLPTLSSQSKVPTGI